MSGNIASPVISSTIDSYGNEIDTTFFKSLSVGTSNYKVVTISLSDIEGKYKFEPQYSSGFWAKNNQLLYRYYLPYYCSGIYYFPYKLKGTNWYDQVTDEGKNVAGIVVLPGIDAQTRRWYIGCDITFVVESKDANIYLSADYGNYGSFVYPNSNGGYSMGKSVEDYHTISVSDLYKLPVGATKITCVPSGNYSKWIITRC